MKVQRDNIISACSLLALVALAYGFVYFTVPLAHDDYWYLKGLKDFGLSADGTFSWLKGAYETARFHHLTDNSRLPNMVGALIVSLPLWVLALISMCAVGLSLILMLRLSSFNARTSMFVKATAVTMGYTFLIPWTDHIFTYVFTYNYIWGAAVMLTAVWLFVRERQTQWWVMLILGFILGGWHEIISFPTLVGAVLCVLFYKKYRTPGSFCLICGLILGCTWLYLSPSRTSSTGYWTMLWLHRPWLRLVHHHWPSLVFLGLELICLCVGSWRKYALSPVSLFVTAFAMTVMPIHFFTDALRCITPEMIMDTVGAVYLLSKILPTPRKPLIMAVRIICSATWIFFFIHMGAAYSAGMDIRNEEEYIVSEYQKVKDTDGVVFCNYTTPREAPWLSFGKPYQELYTFFSHPALITKYFNGKSRLKVIPKDLEGYAWQGTDVKANVEAKAYKGFVIARGCGALGEISQSKAPIAYGIFTYSNGRSLDSSLCYEFTGADSVKYYYLSVPADNLEAIELNLEP